MAKRFTDTEKWEKDFFTELSLKMKLIWIYLCDKCDHAGVWDVNLRLLAFHLGETVTREEIERAFAGKIEWNGKKIFLPSFVDFQYGELNAENRVHRSVLKRLEKVQKKPLASPLLGAKQSAQGAKDKDKDKDKDKEKDKDRGCGGKFKTHHHDDAIAVAAQLKKHGNWSKSANEIQAALGAPLYRRALRAGPHRMRLLPDNNFYIKNISDLLADAAFQMQVVDKNFAECSTQLEEFA